ncbi:MAG: LppX_LprAFG lipoprotein [Thermomicrobiales bacterium]
MTAAESDPNVSDVVAKASATIAKSSSIHFTLGVDGDSWVDPGKTIKLLSAEGDLLRPDKVNVQFKVQILGTANATIKMVTIGEHSWTTDILTGKWGPAPTEFGYNPAVLFDMNDGLGPVISKLTDVKFAGTEKVNGRPAYKITGTSSQKEIALLSAETMTGSSFKVEIWIDKENSQLLKITLAEPSDNGKQHPATWTMMISNYDADVTIEAPE